MFGVDVYHCMVGGRNITKEVLKQSMFIAGISQIRRQLAWANVKLQILLQMKIKATHYVSPNFLYQYSKRYVKLRYRY